MSTLRAIFQNSLFLIFVLLAGNCSAATTSTEVIFEGSTPADAAVKSMLAIPADSRVDFMKWVLTLNDNDSFLLNINYGESQPNTLGFVNDGKNLTLKGTLKVTKDVGEYSAQEVYHLIGEGLSEKISILKIDENILHLLTPQGRLMKGNGGWSYSLNRVGMSQNSGILISSNISDNSPPETVFDGRTPCQEIAAEHSEMKVSSSCFKLKWRMVLNRDPKTGLPTTYKIRKVVDNRLRDDITGKWSIIKGTASNPSAVIYLLDPDKPEISLSFLAGDDNVLFFLNKKNQLYKGNADFSFTMNRRER